MRKLRKSEPKNAHHSDHQSRAAHAKKDFSDIMEEVTHEMPKYRRYFSAFIHSPSIWMISDFLGRTIARPNAILFGAVLSFAVTIGVYLLSKNFGYSLSGFESIGAFLVGWITGILYDILLSLLKRKS